MNTYFKNIIEFQAFFKDEKTCRDYLVQQRWDGVVTCPFCKGQKIYHFPDGKRYKCAERTCRKIFTVTVGTIYENSKVPLQKWFWAMYIIGSHKKGISSCQLAKDLGITQKSAWFIIHRVREMYREKKAEQEKQLDLVVSLDESFVGGKNKNRHWDKKVPNSQGRSHKDKAPVLGARDLAGNVKVQVIKDTRAESIEPLVKQWVKSGSIMVTDDWHGYSTLEQDFFRVVIDHSSGEYVKGGFNNNGIENFWSLLKRGLFGVYHHVSKEHLQRYCEEFAFRYNSRKIKDVDRFDYSLTKCEGRLKYKKLIAEGRTQKARAAMLKIEM